MLFYLLDVSWSNQVILIWNNNKNNHYFVRGPESEDNVSRLNQLPRAENPYFSSKITLKASNTNDNALD